MIRQRTRRIHALFSSPVFFLILVIMAGGILRFYNLNWDQGLSYHPDERNIAGAVSRIRFFDNLDPEFFAYGGFIIYLYRAAAELVRFVSGDTAWTSGWGNINLLGRHFSAAASTLTIPAIFFLARSLFPNDRRVPYYSSFFAAFAVAFIQTAHFSTTENLLVFLVVCLALSSLRLLNKPQLRWSVLNGILLGIAVATKISALSFVLLPLAVQLAAVLRKPNRKTILIRSLLFLDLLLIGSLVFLVFSPHTILSFDKFAESMRYESGVALGRFSVPYTLQFSNTPAYLYQLYNLVWQLGFLAIPALVGLALLPLAGYRQQSSRPLVVFLFPILYFFYVGAWQTKFIRFMFPALPFLLIAASALLSLLVKKHRLLGKAILFFFAAATVFWALAFSSIYTREQTRISASTWIYRNVPDGSRILREHWDDGLPSPLPGDTADSHAYTLEELAIYEPDNDEKLAYYAERLSQGDFLVISSRRLYGTLIRLTAQYPITSRYYKRLFDGNLGYEKRAEFSSYPSLLGITINDDGSEETFQVYDHPRVMVFENRQRFTKDKLLGRLR